MLLQKELTIITSNLKKKKSETSFPRNKDSFPRCEEFSLNYLKGCCSLQ